MGRGRTTTNARTNPERGARDASRAQATASKSKARSADVSATGANLKEWNPKSWRQREALQQPNYENQAELEEALKVIAAARVRGRSARLAGKARERGGW
jgi:3-deoxy-7-phosphoheptulonate synthase